LKKLISRLLEKGRFIVSNLSRRSFAALFTIKSGAVVKSAFRSLVFKSFLLKIIGGDNLELIKYQPYVYPTVIILYQNE